MIQKLFLCCFVVPIQFRDFLLCADAVLRYWSKWDRIAYSTPLYILASDCFILYDTPHVQLLIVCEIWQSPKYWRLSKMLLNNLNVWRMVNYVPLCYQLCTWTHRAKKICHNIKRSPTNCPSAMIYHGICGIFNTPVYTLLEKGFLESEALVFSYSINSIKFFFTHMTLLFTVISFFVFNKLNIIFLIMVIFYLQRLSKPKLQFGHGQIIISAIDIGIELLIHNQHSTAVCLNRRWS